MLARVRNSPLTVPLLLAAASAVLLFARLDEPGRIIFDETYYVEDANDYLDAWVEADFAVHPPVGKWLIAGGIALAGDDPFGWRAAGAAAGVVSVLLTYAIGMRVLRRRSFAALAGLLVATDGLFVVQARTSMLDVFLVLFVVLGAWLLLVDHDRRGLGRDHDPPPPPTVPAGGSSDEVTEVLAVEPRPVDSPDGPDGPDPPDPPTPGLRLRPTPFRLLAGVVFGLAVATKWSGLLALGGAGLVVVGWELAVRRRRMARPWWRLRPALASILVTLVLVPAGAYLASFGPWLAHYEQTSEGEKECPEDGPCDVTIAGRFAGLWRWHRSVLDFHSTLEAEHPYRTAAYTWPVMSRPVVYYWESCTGDRAAGVARTEEDGTVVEPEPCVVEEGEAAEVLAVGNPALWYVFLLALVPLAAGAVRRDPRAWFVLAFWGAQFLPWLVPPMGSRPVFFFYMAPVVPFLALGVAYAGLWLSERRGLLVPYMGAAIGAAAGFGLGLALASVEVARWIGLAVGAIAGAATGAELERRIPVWGQVEPRWSRLDPGLVAAVVVGVLAVGLAIYFYPVWTGLPLPEDAVRQRWWIRPGWI